MTKQTPIIVHVRCEDYKRLGILIGAIGDAGDEGVQILSHEHEREDVTRIKKEQKDGSWKKASEYYPDIISAMTPGKSYNIVALSSHLKINSKYKNNGAPIAVSTIQTLIQKMIKAGKLVSTTKDFVSLPLPQEK